MLIGVPMVCIVISYILMGAGYIQIASYNWWYILFLPFIFTLISASMVSRERKYNYHGLFAITKNKEKIWYAKIGTATIDLVVACGLFCIFTILCGIVFGQQISIVDNILASLLLIITFAWQIPLFMLITLRFHTFVSIIISVICNLVIACICAVESYWWIPFAIPARLMCPVIKVLPNGLRMDANDPLTQSSVIWFGILITAILYIIMSIVSAKIFGKQEV